MATQTQLRRGTAAQNNSFTGAVGELSYDTENKSVRVHDGSTAGGIEVLTGNGDISAKTSDGAALTLETSDTTVTDGSVLGKIEFKAPNEASGTDAILVGAAIEAVAEGTFAADNNATELVFKTGASAAADAKMVISSSGNVGIGTNSPSVRLDVNGEIRIKTNTNGLIMQNSSSADVNVLRVTGTNNVVLRDSTNADAVTIDSSGNLLVGTTDTSLYNNTSGGGLAYRPGNELTVAAESSPQFIVNNTGSDGEMVRFAKDGTTVGSIGTSAVDLWLGTGISGLYFYDGAASVIPWNAGSNTTSDNVLDLGHSSYRWDDIYATNATIQTSDRNEKQDIASLTSAEMLVAKRISALFKTFRWKDKVTTKGDTARTHTGIIAQDVQAAFSAEGLDASKYALWCSDTWWEHDVDVPAVEAVAEVTDEDGNVTTEAVEAKDAYTRTDTYDTEDEAPEGATSKTRMGIRYPELLSFLAAYNEQRFTNIETRLTRLEAG